MSTTKPELMELNKFWLGLLLGIGFPTLFILLYFLFWFSDLTLGQYVKTLLQGNKLLHVISLAVFSNLIPFMFFIRTNRFRAAKGVMTVTILFLIFLFVLKFSM